MQTISPPWAHKLFKVKTAERPSQDPTSSARGAEEETSGKSFVQFGMLGENQSCVSVNWYVVAESSPILLGVSILACSYISTVLQKEGE